MIITDVKCYVVPRPGVKSNFHWRKGLRMPDVPDTVYVGYMLPGRDMAPLILSTVT